MSPRRHNNSWTAQRPWCASESFYLSSSHLLFGERSLCHCTLSTPPVFPQPQSGQIPFFWNLNLGRMDLKLHAVTSPDWGSWWDCPPVPATSIPRAFFPSSFMAAHFFLFTNSFLFCWSLLGYVSATFQANNPRLYDTISYLAGYLHT